MEKRKRIKLTQEKNPRNEKEKKRERQDVNKTNDCE